MIRRLCGRSFLLHFILPLMTALLLFLCTSMTWAQEPAAPSDKDEILHVLNRITFGPRPGDIEMVQKMGLHNYIQQQLHPENLDDSALDQEVSKFELLQMTPQQLSTVYFDDVKKFIKKQKRAQEAQAAAGQPATMQTTDATAAPPQNAATPDQSATMQPATDQTIAGPPQDQAAPQPAINTIPTPVQTQSPSVMDKINEANQWRSVAAIGQIEQAKLVRAIDSQRQLQEVLVDFWNNHFNIDVKKGPDRVLKIADDRDVIRPNIWGKFRDLLDASAKSPAMLFYLDNATNTLARTLTPFQQQMQTLYLQKIGMPAAQVDPATTAQPLKPKKQGGINENYAREIMELHTLGVDGGYTQEDVQEVARCFTGWSFNRQTGEFVFRPRQHDDGAKVVLGHQIPAGGGMQDGETVLDILCASPATAHHIALEMCQRFVSDTPSDALVKHIADVFTQTGGDLRQVTEAILSSPEFLSPANFGNKIKSPLEFTVSAVRASESTIVAQQPPPFDKLVPTIEGTGILGRGQAADRISKRPKQSLNWHIYELGEPLFACTPPTGYKEVSSTWVSPGALIERLNFAMALTAHQLSDVTFDAEKILSGVDLDKPEAVLDQSIAVLLNNEISPGTRKVLEQTALPTPGESKTVDPSKLIALIIGSPEFQRK